MLISMAELISFYKTILEKKGCPPERAQEVARVQVEIHGFGVLTHSLRPLNVLIEDLGNSVDPQKQPVRLLDNGTLQRFDCSGCISIESIRMAVANAGETAGKYGIGLCAVMNTGWIGALGYHLADLARKGFLVLGWVQSSNFANVVPHGGREPRFSTNPMGYSFPVPGSDPAVADFSTSAVSNGKAYQWIHNGKKAPEPLFLDKGGVPVDDPRVLEDGGAMLPTGGVHYGYKGTLLSLWIEAMVAASGIRPIHKAKSGGHNALVLAVDISAMGEEQTYGTYINELCDWVRSSTPAEGSDGVRIPGERGWAALKHASENGLSVSASYEEKIKLLSDTYGIPVPQG